MKAGGTPRGTFDRGDSFKNQRDVKVRPTDTAGASGTYTYGGVIVSHERNRNLVGVERYRVYGEFLRNVWVAAVGVRYFGDLISKPDWTVEPADKSRAARDAAEFVQSCIDQLATPLNRTVRKAAMARFFGYSLFEWTAMKRDDGMLGMLDIESRPQVTIEGWDIDRFGVVHGVEQRIHGYGDTQYIPRGRLLHFVDDAFTDSPEGFGLLRSAVYDIDVLQSYMLLEGQGFETDLRGIPVGRVPLADLRARIGQDGFTQADFDRFVDPIRTFIEERVRTTAKGLLLDSAPYRSNDAGSTPSGVQRYGMELITGGTSAIDSIGKAIERQIHYIACLFQVEHLLIGGSNRGSQALSRDKSDNYGMTGDSCLSEVKHTLQIDFVRPLMTLNGIDKKIEPKLKVGKVQWRDIEQVTGALKDVTVANLDPRDPANGEIRDLLGLSRIPQELTDEIVETAEMDARLTKPEAITVTGTPKKQKAGASPKPKNQRGADEDEDDLDGRDARTAKAFDPDQPRDENGQWSGDGGGDGGGDDDPIEVAPSKAFTDASASYESSLSEWKKAERDVKARRITRAQFAEARAKWGDAVRAIEAAHEQENQYQRDEATRIRQERSKASAPKQDERQGRLFKAFDPDQARDDDGKWTDGGGGGGSEPAFANVKAAQKEVKTIGAKLTGGARRALNIDHLQRASKDDLQRMSQAFSYIAIHGTNTEKMSAESSLRAIGSERVRRGS